MISESKKSLMSIIDNTSEFSTVKVPQEKTGNVSALDTHPPSLEPIEQATTENSPTKENPIESRFKDRQTKSLVKKKGLESHRSLER